MGKIKIAQGRINWALSGEKEKQNKDTEYEETIYCSVDFNLDQNFSYQSLGTIKGQEAWYEVDWWWGSGLLGVRLQRGHVAQSGVQKGSCQVIILKVCCF